MIHLTLQTSLILALIAKFIVVGNVGGFFRNPGAAIGGEASHIAKSVAGGVSNVLVGTKNLFVNPLHQIITYIAPPVEKIAPAVAVGASALIPGGQLFLPEAIGYAAGQYGTMASTQGINSFFNNKPITVGEFAGGVAGAAGGYGYASEFGNPFVAQPLSASAGMNSTQLTEALANPSFNPFVPATETGALASAGMNSTQLTEALANPSFNPLSTSTLLSSVEGGLEQTGIYTGKLALSTGLALGRKMLLNKYLPQSPSYALPPDPNYLGLSSPQYSVANPNAGIGVTPSTGAGFSSLLGSAGSGLQSANTGLSSMFGTDWWVWALLIVAALLLFGKK